jgi:uncharacterized phage-associated protein
MQLQFNEKKATQAAAYLLKHLGGSEYYIKIIKLLYFADRRAIDKLDMPITSDRYVCMDKGPVLSRIYDMIFEGPFPNIPSYWHDYISSPQNYKISLLDDPGTGKLNHLEKEVLDSIIREFGDLSKWDLVDISHRFKEYRDPKGSSLPLSIEDICLALNKSPLEIEKINREIEFSNNLELAINLDC